MKRKYLTLILIIVAICAVVFKVYMDRQNQIEYFDFPIMKDYQLVQSPSLEKNAEYKERFYLKIEDKHIDDGIFYEVENKGIEEGFLLDI